MNLLIFLIGFILGFIIAYIFSGKKEGKKPRLILKTNKYNYHLHHWIIFLLILIILLIVRYYNDMIYGIIIGIIFQGLTYRDFYKIITKPKR